MTKRMIIICIMSMMIGLQIYNVEAYSLQGYKLSSKQVSYMWGPNLVSKNNIYTRAFENAASSWNSASGFKFTRTHLGPNQFDIWYEKSSSLYGKCVTSYNINSKEVFYFKAKLNSGNPNITKSNVARSTACHELGHAMGLGDLSSKTAIMNTSRDRTKIYVPQTDDKNGIKAIYK